MPPLWTLRPPLPCRHSAKTVPSLLGCRPTRNHSHVPVPSPHTLGTKSQPDTVLPPEAADFPPSTMEKAWL